MKRTRLILSATVIAALSGCQSTPTNLSSPKADPAPVATAIGHVVLSPLYVAAGLIQGLASIPYFLDAELRSLDDGFVASGARVSMSKTYQYGYGQTLTEGINNATRLLPARHMQSATARFRDVLRGYGVSNPDHYLLASVRSADQYGYTLYTVIHRLPGDIAVRGPDGLIVRLTPNDRAFYQPYERSATGQLLDVVIDWAGVERASIATFQGQAILMTVAANSVLTNRRSDQYWAVQSKWNNGGFREVVAERRQYLDARIGRS